MRHLLILVLFASLAGCADSPRYRQEAHPNLSNPVSQMESRPTHWNQAHITPDLYLEDLTPEQRRQYDQRMVETRAAWAAKAAKQAPQYTDEQLYQLRMAELQLERERLRANQAGPYDSIAEALAFQGMMGTINSMTQSRMLPVPNALTIPQPSYTVPPVQSPMRCSSYVLGQTVNTNCY